VTPAHAPGSEECRALFARLSEYLDGELGQDLCAKLEGHMSDCPPCRAFLDSLRRTVELTRDLPETPLPDDLRRELLEAWHELRRDEEK
jgi:anti-sigma factor (TIGR02949 family)